MPFDTQKLTSSSIYVKYKREEQRDFVEVIKEHIEKECSR